MTLRNLLWISGIILGVAAYGQEAGEPMQDYHELFTPEPVADTVLGGQWGWDQFFRTSGFEGEKGTQYSPSHGQGTQRIPRDARRTGCVCMDDTETEQRSTGACKGRGGVRYWIYETKEGEEVREATWRHEEHPEALTPEEKSNLSAYQEHKKKSVGGGNALMEAYFNWAIVMTMSLSFMYMFKTMFKK